jgi:hypothetical protein
MVIRPKFARVRVMAITMVAGWICLGVTRMAAAQSQPASAETLFQSGLEKMRKGDYASACPDLAASYELEPLPGALFTLAECEASWGKVATALKHYQQFVGTLSSLTPARRQTFEERRRVALDQMATLAPSVPLISISVMAGAPSNIVVKRDDTIIAESSYGVESPVDPGESIITATKSGKTLWQRRVLVATHDRANIVVPWPLQPTPNTVATPSGGTTPQAPAAGATGETAGHVPRENRLAAETGGNSFATWKYITAGVGAAGFTVSIVAGAIALGKKGTVNDECSDYHCSQDGLAHANSAKQAARVSTVGFIVGLVGAVGFTGLSVFGKPKYEQVQFGSLRVTVDNTTNAGVLRLDGSF